MKKTLITIAVVVAAGAVAYAAYRAYLPAPAAGPAAVDYSAVPLSKPYSNEKYKFSLAMPGNFAVRELATDEDGADTILLESAERADGVQIIMTPFEEDLRTLTLERIRQDVPDLSITEPQPVEIGENYTGLAFKSDNGAFNGASREVWFVFRGNLYQISTYDRLDPLLKKIFATWKFF